MQFVLLTSTWWLTNEGGEQPSQRRVAEFAGTDVMMTSQVLRTLEGKGLIARQDGPADARTKIVSVTPAGSALATKAVRDVEAVDRDFFSLVDDQELLTLLHSLTED